MLNHELPSLSPVSIVMQRSRWPSRRTFSPPHYYSGPSSLGVPGVPGHTQILADQLTLFQPGGTDYANLITTGTPGFSDLTTALLFCQNCSPTIYAPAKRNVDGQNFVVPSYGGATKYLRRWVQA